MINNTILAEKKNAILEEKNYATLAEINNTILAVINNTILVEINYAILAEKTKMKMWAKMKSYKKTSMMLKMTYQWFQFKGQLL